jgi:chromosome segregation ATPase
LSADKLKSWTRRQLEYKSVITRGQIDGLVGYRNELYSQLQQTVEDIKVIEDLGQAIDIGDDRARLEHLRAREMDLRQEIREVNNQIHLLQAELEPVELELAGRRPGDPEMDRYLAQRRKESEKHIRRVVRKDEGLLEKVRRFFVGD